MCGIAGIQLRADFFDGANGPFNGNEGPLSEMTHRMLVELRHRGPDDQGAVIRRGRQTVMSLGHTRLSILDLSPAGHQPMRNARGSLWLTYNGELYNFRELRHELGGGREEWKSQTDTEVLLRAYERWGTDCLQKLRGMFAFGIWDDETEQLVLARDPFGIKPLYYFATENLFIFASEVTAILSTGLIPRKISPAGVTSYLRYGSVSSPLTMVQGIKSLEPGHFLVVKVGEDGLKTEAVSYIGDLFERPSGEHISDRREAVEIVKATLQESVRLHLVSDVELAAFLSGGIDSSAIVALMSRVADVRPKTFSVVFAEDKFNESPYATEVARKFDTEHREIPLTEKDLLAMLPRALAAMDQPTMDGINSYVISGAVKESGITVALSGLGGDELFAGYPSFRRLQQFRSLGSLPSPIRRVVARIGRATLGGSVQQKKAWDLMSGGPSAWNTYAISRRLFSEADTSVLGGAKGIFTHSESPASFGAENLSDSLNEMSVYEMRGYMANTLLRDTDQMSMAHSLEVRVPFIDIEVVRLVLGLPGAWKINGGRQKPLLQDALGDLLPERIRNRPKMGFTIPFQKWMRSLLRDEVENTFADTGLFESIGFGSGGARDVWRRFLIAPEKVGWSRPWALYVLGRWCAMHQVTL
jgi:asparagine synthase (glutamine-hydrolysing)